MSTTGEGGAAPEHRPVRLLWINPIHGDEQDLPISRYLRRSFGDRISADVASFSGPGPVHLEFGAYGALVVPNIVRMVGWAAQAGYDATIIGCYYDPGLRGAREVADGMVVAAPGESSLALSRGIGHRVSIIVVNDGCIPETREMVERNGMADRLAGFQALNMRVPELQQNPDATYEVMRAAGKRAVEEDRADTVLLGCTLEYGMAARLADDLGVPVLDAVDSAVSYALALSSIGRTYGGASSPRAYTRPSAVERELYDFTAPGGVVIPAA